MIGRRSRVSEYGIELRVLACDVPAARREPLKVVKHQQSEL